MFGYLAGFTYWFPKAFGFKLGERRGWSAPFWCWFVGFFVAFMPLYVLGSHGGATRRMNHYDTAVWLAAVYIRGRAGRFADHSCWRPVPGGASCGFERRIVNRNKPGYLDVTGDPWNGRTLEWATSSPPPIYNFAVLPWVVHELDAFWDRKKRVRSQSKSRRQRQRALRADRDAQEQRDRLRHRVLRGNHRLCPDLAHLVDGWAGSARRVR